MKCNNIIKGVATKLLIWVIGLISTEQWYLGCCRISIYRKLSILKKISNRPNFAVSQISKYQDSDNINGGKKCWKYLSENNHPKQHRYVLNTYLANRLWSPYF